MIGNGNIIAIGNGNIIAIGNGNIIAIAIKRQLFLFRGYFRFRIESRVNED